MSKKISQQGFRFSEKTITRAAGTQPVANAWSDLVNDEVTDSVAQQWIIDAALQQRTQPREWFG